MADFLGNSVRDLCKTSLAAYFSSYLITFLILLVGSDDGHEELLAAANAVINPGEVSVEHVDAFNFFKKIILWLKDRFLVELIALHCAAAPVLSSSFWKQMEPFFRFVADTDVAYLKQQVVVFCVFKTYVHYEGIATAILMKFILFWK